MGYYADANFGRVRDDRDSLAQLHALAWAWYGAERRTATFQLRDCGLLPSFVQQDTTAVTYPQLGDLIGTLTAGGTAWTLNTPVTGVIFDAQDNTTTWLTDWSDLDFSA